MSATRLLFFDGTQVTAMRWQSGRIDIEGRFAATPVGHEALVTLCRDHDLGPVLFLTDIAEEGFQLESIPHLQGPDRTALITRRLGQYFYGTPYATAISLGRETTGRRDERVQFAALTRPEMFEPWIEQLRTERIPLRGIYSLPLVLSRQKLAFVGDAKRFILVTVSQGGLRQTFFDGGQMRFSRLTQLPGIHIEAIATTCSRETTKTVQYLLGQRQISRGTRLPVFVLAHPEHHAGLIEHCQDAGDVSYTFVDLVAAATTTGLKSPVIDSFCDTTLAHLLARNPPAEQFAPASERKMLRLWQARFALRATAIILLVAGLLTGGKLTLDASLLNSESEQLAARTANSQQRYQAILSSLPIVSVTPANLRAVLGSVDEISLHSPGLRQALSHLGATLNEFPAIELKQLKWQVSDKPALDPKVGAGGTAFPASAATPVMPAMGAASAWSILEIDGALPLALVSDQRRQIEAVNQLVTHLQRDNSLVRVVTMPVDIQSDKALRSEERSSGDSTAKIFKLQLSVPHPPAPELAPAVRNTP